MAETVSVTLLNNGSLNGQLQVEGVMNATINDAKYSASKFRFENYDDKDFNYRPHPKINKEAWSKGVVELKSEGKGFPVGNTLNILKWRFVSRSEAHVPIIFNCWPTDEDGTTLVNAEYEFKPQGNDENFSIGEVCIGIPIVGSAPVVNEVDIGVTEFDVKNHILYWKLDLIDSKNPNGALEFTIPSGGDPGGLFPVKITFTSLSSYCPLVIAEVVNRETGAVPYAFTKLLQTEEYIVRNK